MPSADDNGAADDAGSGESGPVEPAADDSEPEAETGDGSSSDADGQPSG